MTTDPDAIYRRRVERSAEDPPLEQFERQLGQEGLKQTQYERAEALGISKDDLTEVSELVRDSQKELGALAGAMSR